MKEGEKGCLGRRPVLRGGTLGEARASDRFHSWELPFLFFGELPEYSLETWI